jgi:hypothetical protein
MHYFSNLFWYPDLANRQTAQPVWHIPVAVYTVLDSWWWTVNLSDTCRVLYHNKFEKSVYLVGFSYKNISRCAVLWMSNKKYTLHLALPQPCTCIVTARCFHININWSCIKWVRLHKPINLCRSESWQTTQWTVKMFQQHALRVQRYRSTHV